MSPHEEGGETAKRFALLPRLPSDETGPVFAEPWQAQAFALAVQLHAAGAFSWSEWATALSTQLSSADDDGTHYYEHWLAALECLVARRGLVAAGELAARKDAWAEAYCRTPHGRPVEL